MTPEQEDTLRRFNTDMNTHGYASPEQVKELQAALDAAEQRYEQHLAGCAAQDETLRSIGLVDDSGEEAAGCWRNARAEAAERERDLAIAHDRQPYPTADAYEAACKALEVHRKRADAAEQATRTICEAKSLEDAQLRHLETERDALKARVAELEAKLNETNAALLYANDMGAEAVQMIQKLETTIVAKDAALEGADWIIKKLAPHEALAITIRGYKPSDEDIATGAKYRAMIDAALSPSAGKGWLSPEQAEQLQGQVAQMRTALDKPQVADLCDCEDCQKVKAKAMPFTCETCGYTGAPGTLECACYDSCCSGVGGGSNGAGCFHGGLVCPVCGDGEEDGWELVKRLRAALSPDPSPMAEVVKAVTCDPRVLVRVEQQYQRLIDPIRDKARELGYAIAVHGSLYRDIDLVAVAWTEDAVDPERLVSELASVVERLTGAGFPDKPERKPHGRLAWVILPGGGSYIDLSVIGPRVPITETAAGEVVKAAVEWAIEVERHTPRLNNFGVARALLDAVAAYQKGLREAGRA